MVTPPTPAAADLARLRVADHMSEQVWQVSLDATLLAVAGLLTEHTISCAIVTNDGRPVGILSERDLVRAITEDPSGWSERTAGDTMTRPLRAIEPGASVGEAIDELRRLGIRRLPVLAGPGRLAGIVTQTDLLRAAHGRLRDYASDLERLVAERTAELRASERQRGDLVDLTAHDIKNWLNAATSALEILAMDPAEMPAMLPVLRHATDGIGRLVCTLLDVNRLESGAMPLKITEVPWSAICGPMIEEASVLARTKSVTLAACGDGDVILRCDATLMERVLLNLLDNAVNAAPRDTTIDVLACPEPDGTFKARVGNRGPVIPATVLPTLFEKYRRGGTPSALPTHGLDRFRGWGLGLTFCRLAIEHHGGTIRAISPYVDGEGTAFEFTVPPEQGGRPAAPARCRE